jgi:hypothetical protein
LFGDAVKELFKLGSAIPAWPWAKVGSLLALGLLYRGVVNFDEALVLTLLAIIIGRSDGRKSHASDIAEPKVDLPHPRQLLASSDPDRRKKAINNRKKDAKGRSSRKAK